MNDGFLELFDTEELELIDVRARKEVKGFGQNKRKAMFSMLVAREQNGFESAELQREISKLRRVDNITNLAYLAMEYCCLIAVIGGTIAFALFPARWSLAWLWNIPVFTVAIILIGGIQHRLAGLGHEAAHYCFMKNRLLNDLIPDVFCMFPLLTCVHFYRLFHMAHHKYTNDLGRDPDPWKEHSGPGGAGCLVRRGARV